MRIRKRTSAPIIIKKMELNYFELQFFLSNLYSEATLNTKTTNIYQGRDGLNKTLREERVPVEDGVVLELLIGGRERGGQGKTKHSKEMESSCGSITTLPPVQTQAVTPCQRQSQKWKNEMGKKENKQCQCVSSR